MTIHYLRNSAAIVLGAFCASAASADVTAQDVWTDWRAYLEGAGYSVEFNEQESANVLTLSDVKLSAATPDTGGTFTATLSQLDLTEGGDGTVTVDFPDTFPMTFSASDETGENIDVELAYTQTGETLVVSGSPDAMDYDYSADRVGFVLKGLSIDGAPSQVPATLDVGLVGVSGKTSMTKGDLRNYTQDASAQSATLDVNFSDPGAGGKFAMSATANDVGYTGGGNLPLAMDPNNVPEMLAKGLNFAGDVTFGAANSNVSGEESGQSFAMTSSTSGGAVSLALGGSEVAYSIRQTDVASSITASDIPFPVSYSADEVSAGLSMPVAKSEEAQDFSLKVALKGLTLAEQIWSLVDPSGVLPRDPATIALDLSGKAKLLYDIMNPDVTAQLEAEGTAPGEIDALTINEITVSAAGARVDATGDFTFDNNDLATYDGIPKPVGAIEINLAGANALMDKLVQMGLLPQEQAMAARMMSGLFAVPGDGPDTLKSKIEMTDQGQILANGQRLK